MSLATAKPIVLPQRAARRVWLRAQGLAAVAPFGDGPGATPRAIAHLGYVQIDTINVIERCHHHILWSRIPDYRRAHLRQAQSLDKTVFEYWTHALSYVATTDMPFFLADMKRHRAAPRAWFDGVESRELRNVMARIRRGGPLSIRDIDDDELVEKTHAWASRKPSKRALQLAFYNGQLAVAARAGMLKTYELTERHFGWQKAPRAATEKQVVHYLLDRALRAQGVVSLDSICHLDARRKPIVRAAIDARVRRRELQAVTIMGAEHVEHWMRPDVLDDAMDAAHVPLPPGVHVLSPFDPLVIQRKRLQILFDYAHRFEAYVPKPKRLFGYFALPILVDDRIVAVIDLKTDRIQGKLLIQQWTWIDSDGADRHGARIDEALHRFERFQLDVD